MPAVSQTAVAIQKIRDDVTDLQRDMAKVGLLVDRLDTTIDKLSEFSGNISKLIAIHETKLEFHKIQNIDLLQEIKDLRTESTTQHNELSKRISVMEKWMWLVVGGSIVTGFIINIVVKILT
jgi:chromosome segregation ATPase